MRVVLGVGGGIAAYKSAELVRALQQRGHEVQVVMTGAAQEFVQPLTFAALTGRKVITGLFSQASAQDTLSSAVEHIAVAQEHDVFAVAPATAAPLSMVRRTWSVIIILRCCGIRNGRHAMAFPRTSASAV